MGCDLIVALHNTETYNFVDKNEKQNYCHMIMIILEEAKLFPSTITAFTYQW